MMTNGVCSVFRPDNNGVVPVGVFPCMWQENYAYEVKKYGESNADNATVFVPDMNADIREKDFVFFGKVQTPADKELYNALRVHSIDVRNYGSSDMQHLQIGAR